MKKLFLFVLINIFLLVGISFAGPEVHRSGVKIMPPLQISHTKETLSADRTILITDNPILWFDCNGADRNVTLTAEAFSTDHVRTIYNDSDGAGENLVIRDDTPTTLITIGPKQGARVSCDGTSWEVWFDNGIYYDAIGKKIKLNNRMEIWNSSNSYIGLTIYSLDTDSTATPIRLKYGGANGSDWTLNNTALTFRTHSNRDIVFAPNGTGDVLIDDCNIISRGLNWTSQIPSADHDWRSVTYGNGLFVAVASNVTNAVMTSPDGVHWAAQNTPGTNNWLSITYGDGLFVVVGNSGTGDRVMTSPNGEDWTLQASAADNSWHAVTYGNGLFVAVAYSGTNNRVMTSPDGIAWTIQTTPADNYWREVIYGNGLFVAVAYEGTDRVMTSPDGIIWTLRTPAADYGWHGITYGNGLFVAVAQNGTNRIMTSSDGITWTLRTPFSAYTWYGITYGDGLFVAVGSSRLMISSDGITWRERTSSANSWRFVTYGNGLFVAVAGTGTNRVLTSGKIITNITETNHIQHGGMKFTGETELQGRKVLGDNMFSFTTEADITDPLLTSVVLLSGDNDSDNDVIDLQDGETACQILYLIAHANIDADDTCTINMADTTCTNCPAIIFNKVGENAFLIWTGSTWVIISLQSAL